MAKHYYVNDNPQPNGDHEVHENDCSWLALAISKTYLGYFDNCRPAVEVARQKYAHSNGCAYCCPACHTS